MDKELFRVETNSTPLTGFMLGLTGFVHRNNIRDFCLSTHEILSDTCDNVNSSRQSE